MKIAAIAIPFLLLFSAPGIEAQQTPEYASAETIIGPDDGVTILAIGEDDISKTWRVSSTGDLALPLVGDIHAAGMTTTQLEQELVTKLTRFIRNPAVTVYVSEFRSEAVTVEGAVDKPGRIQTEGQKTLLDVLMMAGGTKAPGSTMKVTRTSAHGIIPLPGARRDLEGNFSTVELPVKEVLDPSTPAANLIMEPDDVVYVSTESRLVYVMGEVNHAGAVELVTQDSVSIIQVLAAAGGMTKVAAPRRTQILRKDSEGRYHPIESFDLKKVLEGKQEDKLLLAGDIVVVPSSNAKFYTQTVLMSVATGGVTSGLFILSKY